MLHILKQGLTGKYKRNVPTQAMKTDDRVEVEHDTFLASPVDVIDVKLHKMAALPID
jgi:hypothetical protein